MSYVPSICHGLIPGETVTFSICNNLTEIESRMYSVDLFLNLEVLYLVLYFGGFGSLVHFSA